MLNLSFTSCSEFSVYKEGVTWRVRSGVAGLDQLMNGGFPMGSICLIKDPHQEFGVHLLRCFLGEGSINSDSLHVFSKFKILLPGVDTTSDTYSKYHTFALNSEVQSPYEFDLSDVVESEDLQYTPVETSKDRFKHVWDTVNWNLSQAKISNQLKTNRIVIYGIFDEKAPQFEIYQFLKSLKTLLKSKNAVCLVLQQNPHQNYSKLLEEASEVKITVSNTSESEARVNITNSRSKSAVCATLALEDSFIKVIT